MLSLRRDLFCNFDILVLSKYSVGFPPGGAFSVTLCFMLFVLFVSQIFIAIWLSFILESCKNRLIKLDITSAYIASESTFLSKSDNFPFVNQFFSDLAGFSGVFFQDLPRELIA